jgi:hypothetical protein
MADGTIDINAKPTEEIPVRETFGIDTDMIVKGFACLNSIRLINSIPTPRSPSLRASPTTAA